MQVCRCSCVVAVALVITLVPTLTYAQSSESTSRQIDGSTRSSFEASIARMQNELRPRRREDFEAALAAIWIGRTVGTGDLDGDGDVDSADIRALVDDAGNLLTDIQRGNLLSAIEVREQKSEGVYTVAAFMEQLDGLGYDEVLGLAGGPRNEPFLDVLADLRAGFSGPAFRSICALYSRGLRHTFRTTRFRSCASRRVIHRRRWVVANRARFASSSRSPAMGRRRTS